MTTDAYQPPAIVDLPEPLPAAALAQLRADVAFNEAAAEAAFARLLGGAQARATRDDALAQYERVAALAMAMGEGDRICKRPLKSLSANEISDMAYGLGLALDRVAAKVPGYVK